MAGQRKSKTARKPATKHKVIKKKSSAKSKRENKAATKQAIIKILPSVKPYNYITGRPTLYGEEAIARASEYVAKYRELGNFIPQIAGLAVHLGISRETVYAWYRDKDKQAFSDIIEQLMATQESELVDKGLVGAFNPVITKLVLGKHGYSDKQEHTGNIAHGVVVQNMWVIKGVKPVIEGETD